MSRIQVVNKENYTLLVSHMMLLQSAQELVTWWLAGELKPHIGARVPLERANDAFALIESRASTGKVVLVP